MITIFALIGGGTVLILASLGLMVVIQGLNMWESKNYHRFR